MKTNYDTELYTVKAIVDSAYHNVIKNKGYKIFRKEDENIITDLDVATEEFIVAQIRKVYPGDHFVTEQRYNRNKITNRTWIIDPIDGTNNFTNGLPNWAIQLAFVDGEQTMFSIIYAPILNEMYVAKNYGDEAGVYRNNVKLTPLTIESNPEYTVELCMSFNTVQNEYKEIFNTLKKERFINTRVFGSSGLGYCNLVSNKTQIYVNGYKENPWDNTPGELMCELLGIKKVVYSVGNRTFSIYSSFDKILSNFGAIVSMEPKTNKRPNHNQGERNNSRVPNKTKENVEINSETNASQEKPARRPHFNKNFRRPQRNDNHSDTANSKPTQNAPKQD